MRTEVMWLVVMTRTLDGWGVGPLLRNRCLCGTSRGRVHAAMKQLGTCTGSCRTRNSDGEQPTMVVKVRLNVPRLAKPTSHAMSVTGRSVCRSSVIARSTRRRWR